MNYISPEHNSELVKRTNQNQMDLSKMCMFNISFLRIYKYLVLVLFTLVKDDPFFSKVKMTIISFLQKKDLTTIPLAPMGVLAPGSSHAKPSARPPIDTSGNFSAHVSAESLL
jgi:hypothetical protein